MVPEKPRGGPVERPLESVVGERRTEGLILSVSEDGETWERIWQAEECEPQWLVRVTSYFAGADVPGRPVRYLKVATEGEQRRPLILQRFTVYGDVNLL
jgi:hypothetical protein